jgi:hypothetical protein
MTALAWVVGIGVVALVIAGRFVAVGRTLPKTLVDERRDALGGMPPRYRITQPGAHRRQWRVVERRRKSA